MNEPLQDLPERIASFPLLDAQGALALLGGNAGLYAKVAAGYRNALDDFARQCAALLAAARISEARASLHTAKGLALTVGAQRLAELCRLGERRLRGALEAGQAVPASELEALQAALLEGVALTAAELDACLPLLMR